MTIYNSSDFGLGPNKRLEPLERFQGFLIFHCDDGYYWGREPSGDGYFDTLEECRQSICDHNNDLDDNREKPLDTPSLDDSFHRHEMDLD